MLNFIPVKNNNFQWNTSVSYSTNTNKLVKLVAELNEQINSSKAHSLTPKQLQMVAEIEKLAHSVRDKMRMTYRTVEMRETIPLPPLSSR